MTKVLMPEKAKKVDGRWPVYQDHCFQRIVLDNVCQGAWYEFIPQPAYVNLSYEQAYSAVSLCWDILTHQQDLNALNKLSLNFRKKQQSFQF